MNDTDSLAYAIYCFKQITFDDGTTWENPQYQQWLDTYQNKTISPKALQGYYPYSVAVS